MQIKNQTRMVRILMFPTPNNEWGIIDVGMRIALMWFFEEKVFRGIKDYDSYLSFKYGDYMKLPPTEKRKMHPVSAFELMPI